MSQDIRILLEQAVHAEQSANWLQAEQLYRRVLSLKPDHPEASYSLAFMYMRHGHAKPAWTFIQAAKKAYKDFDSFWFQYAQIAFKLNHFTEALEACQNAIHLDSKAQYWLLLSQAQIKLQHITDAIKSLKEVLISQPEHQLAHHYLGALYLKQNQSQEARVHLEQAVILDPKDLESLNNLGFAYIDLQEFTHAEQTFARILQQQPGLIAAIEGLVKIYTLQNKKAEAIALLQESLPYAPQHPVLHFLKQSLCESETDIELNIAYFTYKHKEDPQNLDFLRMLFKVYAIHGDFNKSKEIFEQLIKIIPEQKMLFLAKDLLMPLMGQSAQEQETWHQELESKLDHWLEQNIQFEDTDLDYFSAQSLFAYTYQTRGDGRKFREKWTKLFEPHFRSWEANVNQEEPHIGFLVTKGHEGIFIKSMEGILNRLNLQNFKVSIFATDIGYENHIQKKIHQPRIHHVPITQVIPEIARTVREAKCDILNFWEIGTDTQNFFLPFYRLAPIQTLGWGWPITTGNPKVDYYLSSQGFEVEQGDDFYTEKLLRFRGLSSYYYRPRLNKASVKRSDLGLPENKPLYFCSQNLLKIHPDFDDTVKQILDHDGDAQIYFLLSKYISANSFFEERLKNYCKQHSNRVFFIKRRPFEDYLQLISVMDLMLDTFHYVGANTTLDAFTMGVPVITLPTNYQRGRFTYAAYQEMQIQDAIAQDSEHYVNLVEHFGKNRDARQELSQKILSRCDVLFENQAVVDDYQSFFEETLHRLRS